MKTHRITSNLFCIFLVLLSLASCLSPNTWHYLQEDGVFKTQDGSFAIDFRPMDAVFLADGEYLELDFGVHNTLLHISFYNHVPYEMRMNGICDDDTLLYVDVEADKNTKTLTLTVTGGSLEQYIGNVYVLNFYPGEELNLDAVTTQETVEAK